MMRKDLNIQWRTGRMAVRQVAIAWLIIMFALIFAADLYALTRYTITASAGSGGSISPSGAVSVNAGNNKTFSITPNTGYHVADVTVDGVAQGAITSYTFTNVNADHTITASFGISSYSITATAAPAGGGNISPQGTTILTYGGSQTYSITPNSGYRVADVTVDGASQGAITSYTFSNVAANHTIQASFTPTNVVFATNCSGSRYTDADGVIYQADADYSGGYYADTTATIAGTADGILYQTERYGWEFSYNVPVANGNYNVTLKFAEIAFTAPGQRVFSVDINGQTVIRNLDIYAAVGANTAYDVVIPVNVTNGAINIAFTSLIDDAKVSAIKITTASSASYAITESAGTGGTISPAGTVTVNPGGSQTLTITPNSGYHIVDVLVDGVSQGAISSYTFSNVAANHTIQPIFFSSSGGNHFAVNSAGPQYTDSTGLMYLSDILFSGGYQTATDAAINGTVDDALYQIERYGWEFSYHIPAANGNYKVTLKFAEINYTASGQRIFNVAVNGQTVISNLDIYARVGANTAYDVEIPVTVTNGAIDIDFIPQNNDPQICAIKIVASTFTITASAGSGGTISPTGSVTVNSGGSQTFTISPNTGYHVSDVTVDGTSQGAITSYTFTNVTANHTIAATFAINTYSITATAGSGGTVTPTTATVNYGGSQTFTIAPNTGYNIANVTVDGTSQGAITSYTFTNVTANHTIAATFAINTYSITATAGSGGTVTPTTATVNYGGSQTFTITPDAGYHITDVTIDGASQGVITSYTFANVTASHSIAATFAATTYTISATAGSNGSISPTGAVVIASGTSQTFTVKPNAGYIISDVTVDGVSQGTGGTYTFTNATADHTIAVAFVANSITLTIDSPSGGDTKSRPDVMVKGTVANAGGYETGVMVNGVVAIIYGNQFVANHVPLQEGSNVITVTATDAYGTTSTASVTVNAVNRGNYIRLTVDTESGVAPLSTTLRVDGTFSIANSSLSATGPVQPDVLTLSADKNQVNMTAEGIYFFTASVTGPDGNPYQETIAVGVLNLAAVDNLLRGKWNAMVTSLGNRDITTALTYISANTKTIYQEMFTAIIDHLPAMVASQTGLDLVSIGNKSAVYKLKTLENGDVYAYQVTFVKDSNGLWVIQDF